MTADIVERLRGNYNDSIKRKPSAIKLEAADEIERLRAALRIGFDTLHRMEQVLAAGLDQMARPALEPKP